MSVALFLLPVSRPEGSRAAPKDRLSLALISSPCKEDKPKKLFALLIYSLIHTHAHTCIFEWQRRRNKTLTFEFYQTEALSYRRLALDSDMLIVQLSLSVCISNLFPLSFIFLSYITLYLSLIFSHAYLFFVSVLNTWWHVEFSRLICTKEYFPLRLVLSTSNILDNINFD